MSQRAYKYETVAASQTDQVLGSDGAKADALVRIVVTVATAATSTCSIKDGGGSAIVVTAANTPIGVYTVDFGPEGLISQTGAWTMTTGAGCAVLVVGYLS